MAPGSAFSLIELLVVITIIGLLASIGVPALKGLGGSNDLGAANRQLLDDLSFARVKAISERTTVYVVFVSPQILNQPWNGAERREVAKLADRQYASYALFAKRSLGDQPGAGTPRYITDWRRLPEGTFIATNKFDFSKSADGEREKQTLVRRPLWHEAIPFPTATNAPILLPVIAFDYQGRLKQMEDAYLPVSRGSLIFPQEDPDKRKTGNLDPAEVIETPKGNFTNNPVVRVDWLTGRARIERPEKVNYAAMR